MSTWEAAQVFNGSMLSDASLHVNGNGVQFNMALVGALHIDWLNVIAQALTELGALPCTGYPKLVVWKRSKSYGEKAGQEYIVCRLTTRNSSYLKEQLGLWYLPKEEVAGGRGAGVKRVPCDLPVTPITLAHWFMGDGNSYKYHRYEKDHTTSVRFATHKFSANDIEYLRGKLSALGVNTTTYPYHRVRSGSGLEIFLLQDSVDHLMSIIKPYVVPSYEYKLKTRG